MSHISSELPVTPIIIHWRAVSEIQKQLTLLNSESFSEIIVVDNSQQLTAHTVTSWNKKTTLISNHFNRGYAFAANAGGFEAKNEWLLFLNPDVEITAQDIETMISYAQVNKLDAVSPHPTSKNYHKPLPTLGSLITEFTFLHRFISLDEFNQKTLTGGCLLIKKSVFLDLQGWDERFFLWFEDSDLTQRLLDHSFTIGWCPVNVTHIGGQSFHHLSDQHKKDIFFHSLLVYADKHFSPFEKKCVNFICNRFTQRKMLPELNPNMTTVVVPNVKPELIEEFLDTNDVDDEQTEYIVVSSGLNLQRLRALRKKHHHIRYISLAENKGFAHTVNVGLRAASGKSAGTCNDDVTLPRHWVSNLKKNFSLQTGSVNPIITSLTGTIESAGINILKKGKAEPIQEIIQSTEYQTDATNGACVLYGQAALNEVGIFDERFGSYLEDIDLSLRLTRNGYTNIINPKVTVIHKKHQTSNTFITHKAWLDAKNWWLVILKNWSLQDWILHGFEIVIERSRNSWGIGKSLLRKVL